MKPNLIVKRPSEGTIVNPEGFANELDTIALFIIGSTIQIYHTLDVQVTSRVRSV